MLFDLVVFDQSWGRWGVGAVALFPTATRQSLGADKWALGPALGFVARNKKFMWSVFNQNLFSYAGDNDRSDVNVSNIQPIFNYSLPNKWTIGVPEMNLIYDWENGGWSNLPLGIKIAKLQKIGKLPIQFAGAYEYNFADKYISPEWTFTFTVKFLFPI